MGAPEQRPGQPPGDDDRGVTREHHLTWWLLGGAAIVGAVVATALTLSSSASKKQASDEASLPEPRDPVTHPLSGPAPVGMNWTWVNPLPRAMPPWRGVDVVEPGLVAIVGEGGHAARFVDQQLFRWRTGTDVALHDVAWLDKSRALAVGEEGTIRMLGAGKPATEPAAVDSTTRRTLWGVARWSDGEGSLSALIVGQGGTLLRYDTAVEPLSTPTEEALLGVHVRESGGWIVGDGGTILRLRDGEIHRERSGTRKTLRAVGGCEQGNLYAAGDNGLVLRRVAQDEWHPLSDTGDEDWADVACDGGRTVIVGRAGGVLLVAGKRSVRLESGSESALHGVSGNRQSGLWMVGDGGRLALLEGARVRSLTSGPSVPLFDAATLGGALVGVGQWGGIVRQQGDRLERAKSPTELALAAVAPLGADRLIAVGDSGVLLEITWNDARLLETPSRTSWRGVVSENNRLLAVGEEARILRGAPGALQESRTDNVGTLWDVAGVPSEAVAVGQGGMVVRIDDAGHTRVPCATDATLRGVVRTSDGYWAVGDAGTIVRIDDERCRKEHESGSDLYGVGPGPRGRLLAVGRHGTVLERATEGRWTAVRVGTDHVHLRAVVQGPRYVYIVGSGGVVLRHVQLKATAEEGG